MRKLWFTLAIMAFGCGQAPSQQVDQAASGKELAALRAAASPAEFVRIHNRHARDLFEYESFQELDAYLERAAQWDPVETLCTPTSMLLELRSLQKGGEVPWLIVHSENWVARPGHSRWAEVARVIAFVDEGEDMCASTNWDSYSPWDQGQQCLMRALKYIEALKAGDPGWPLLGYYRRVYSNADKAMLASVHEHPTEIALYSQLALRMQKANRNQRLQDMQALIQDSPANYALLFTVELKNAHGKISTGNWQWEPLRQGFEKLLEDHPNALGVRNAMAAAALAYEDKALAARQAALLGSHWDPEFWRSLQDYQQGLGTGEDHHLRRSQFPSLALDESIAKHARMRYTDSQAECLLKKGLWVALETYLRELPEPYQRFHAAQSLESGDEETEASYKARETLLRNWQAERPDSPPVATALAGFYISHAWLARGQGYASTVSSEGWKKYRERIETASQFLKAPVDERTNANALQHKMTMLKAGSFDRQAADQLALLGARRGMEGVPVLQEYFACLMPRWHGEPGDLEEACDQLKQQTGNDDAYYVMADLTIEYEGADAVLKPGHPCHIDWPRALSAYLTAARAQRSDSHWAHKTLWNAYCCEQRTGAVDLLPFLPTVDPADSNEWPVCLIGIREWAEGKADLVAFEREKWTYKPIGSKRQKAKPQSQDGHRRSSQQASYIRD